MKKNDALGGKAGGQKCDKSGCNAKQISARNRDQKNERVLDLNKVTPADLYRYMMDHVEELSQPGHYFGGWVDGDHLFLDVSVETADEAQAQKIAADNDQLSYFDFHRMDAVPTPGRTTTKDAAPSGRRWTLTRAGPGQLTLDDILALHKWATGRDATSAEIEEVKALIEQQRRKKGQSEYK